MDDQDTYFDGDEPRLDAILEAFPEYRPQAQKQVDLPSSRTAKAPSVNPWVPETRNLTEQARILRDDPSLARRLKEEAGL